MTLSLSELRRLLEQLPHQLSALSTQGITSGSGSSKYRLPPPNTSLLEKSVSVVNKRLAALVNQIDLMYVAFHDCKFTSKWLSFVLRPTGKDPEIFVEGTTLSFFQ